MAASCLFYVSVSVLVFLSRCVLTGVKYDCDGFIHVKRIDIVLKLIWFLKHSLCLDSVWVSATLDVRCHFSWSWLLSPRYAFHVLVHATQIHQRHTHTNTHSHTQMYTCSDIVLFHIIYNRINAYKHIWVWVQRHFYVKVFRPFICLHSACVVSLSIHFQDVFVFWYVSRVFVKRKFLGMECQTPATTHFVRLLIHFIVYIYMFVVCEKGVLSMRLRICHTAIVFMIYLLVDIMISNAEAIRQTATTGKWLTFRVQVWLSELFNCVTKTNRIVLLHSIRFQETNKSIHIQPFLIDFRRKITSTHHQLWFTTYVFYIIERIPTKPNWISLARKLEEVAIGNVECLSIDRSIKQSSTVWTLTILFHWHARQFRFTFKSNGWMIRLCTIGFGCWLSRTKFHFHVHNLWNLNVQNGNWKIYFVVFFLIFYSIFGIVPLFVHSLRAAFRASIWCFYADAHVHQIAWKDRKEEKMIANEEKTLHQYKPACITIQFDENCKSANNGNWTDESEMQARKRKIAF